MNRRDFFAANAALAVGTGLPELKTCKHHDWNIAAQVCNQCGKSAKELVMAADYRPAKVHCRIKPSGSGFMRTTIMLRPGK